MLERAQAGKVRWVKEVLDRAEGRARQAPEEPPEIELDRGNLRLMGLLAHMKKQQLLAETDEERAARLAEEEALRQKAREEAGRTGSAAAEALGALRARLAGPDSGAKPAGRDDSEGG